MELNLLDFKNNYLSWLREQFHSRKIGEYVEIVTPFLDFNNDHLAIYVRKESDDKLWLTDDGYVINEWSLIGCDINTPARQKIAGTILNRYGVKFEDDELVVECSLAEFPAKKHMLLQAMLSINDMFMLSRRSITSIFAEEVAAFLDEHEVRYTEDVQFTGKSGFVQTFDFAIPRSKRAPERLMKVINNPTKSQVELAIFAWDDISSMRTRAVRMLVFLNDSEKAVSADIVSALENYDITSLLWSKKHEYIHDLAS